MALRSGLKYLIHLKISEEDFSITAKYTLVFTWHDKRLSSTKSTMGHNVKIEENLIHKIWTPLVDLNHVKSSHTDHGFIFADTVFSLIPLANKLYIEYLVTTKPQITCPMEFNMFPFDTQYCHFIFTLYEFNVPMVNILSIRNMYMAYKQNIVLEYEVEFLDLPESMKKIEQDTVKRKV